MAWGWLGASSFLLVIAAAFTYVAMTRLSRPRFEPIGAEKMASDVLEQESGSSTSSDAYSFSNNTERKPSKVARLAIFGAGSLSLLLGLLFIAIAVFTGVTWVIPTCFVVMGFSAFAFLRALAVRDQRARYESADSSFSENASVAYNSDETELQANPTKVKKSASAPSSARVLQAKPVAASVKSLRYARTHRDFERYTEVAQDNDSAPQPRQQDGVPPMAHHQSLEVEDTSWQPVEVPRPLYLDTEEHFQHIEPVELQAEPQARSKTLQEAASGSIRFDLDDVLKRRRA